MQFGTHKKSNIASGELVPNKILLYAGADLDTLEALCDLNPGSLLYQDDDHDTALHYVLLVTMTPIFF